MTNSIKSINSINSNLYYRNCEYHDFVIVVRKIGLDELSVGRSVEVIIGVVL